MNSIPVLLAAGSLWMLALMTLLWRLHLPGAGRARPNAAWVDVGWAGGFGVLALLYAACGDAPGWRRLWLAVLVPTASFRLAFHLYRDRVSGGKDEDKRYAGLRPRFGAKAFLGMFLGQGLLVVLLSACFLPMAFNPNPSFVPWDGLGLALWAMGVGGEAIADAQLKAFKAAAGNRGRVCDTGLWGTSRHPNYFFEWVTWVSYAVMAVSAPWGATAWLSPAVMLFLLLKVSGVPLSERYSLASRGDAYAAYQKRTSAFVPWFPRKVDP